MSEPTLGRDPKPFGETCDYLDRMKAALINYRETHDEFIEKKYDNPTAAERETIGEIKKMLEKYLKDIEDTISGTTIK